jgi:hypothetical protein
MSIFLESPWPIISIGIVVELVLGIVLWCTGRGRVLWMMLGVLGFALLGFLLQWLVVTDREAINNLLHDCAAAAKANDVERILAHVSPEAVELRTDIRQVLERAEVTLVWISDLQLKVDRRANPPVANARFKVIAQGNDRKGQYPYKSHLCKPSVDFRLQDDRWIIVACHEVETKIP